jgi:mevalonate kinase
MKEHNEQFPAKILLFGEYTILLHSNAFALPFERFGGKLVIDDSQENKTLATKELNKDLHKFLNFLKRPDSRSLSNVILQIDEFEKDINNGLFFKSTIPENYGLGSSGALIAAIYSKYFRVEENASLETMLEHLSFLESFYHLKSSGIDPLVCYLQKPIFSINSHISCPNILTSEIIQQLGIFLIDTGCPAKTRTSVSIWWNDVLNQVHYRDKLTQDYIPLNNRIIESIKNGGCNNLNGSLTQLTEMQLDLFKPMFTEKIHKLAIQGLQSQLFTIKLCGSGGGGYFLGFTKNLTESINYLSERGIKTMQI